MSKGLRRGLTVIVGFILLCQVFSVASYFDPNQPKWNWEEVILSRNGPSTTTTPRPKVWSTTTLRNMKLPAVHQEGSVGIVEDARLVPLLRFERADEHHDEDTHHDSHGHNAASKIVGSSVTFIVTCFYFLI